MRHLTIDQLAAELEPLHLRSRTALKWSTSSCDWYALWRALKAIGKADCRPRLEIVVKPLNLSRKMYGLYGVVSKALENLLAVLIPVSDLVGTHHLADFDLVKLYQVTQHFKDRTMAMQAKGRIALGVTQVNEDDE